MKFTITLLVFTSLVLIGTKAESTTDTWHANENGTVTDVATALEWQREPTSNLDYSEALSYCQALDLAGKTDWRLPHIKELTSIVDHRKFALAQDRDFGVSTLSAYWSETPQSNDPAKAWQVSFLLGQVSIPADKTDAASVRCVRN